MSETNHPSSLATCTLIQDFLGVKEGGIYEAVVKQKQQLDAVVAECADMKNAQAAVLEHISVTDKGPAGTAAMIASDALYNTETPNVTAALAEVEAKAIEKFADEQKEKLKAAALIGATRLEACHEFAALQAQAFAVELREGRA